jgi:CheY-like chemotaxis protein
MDENNLISGSVPENKDLTCKTRILVVDSNHEFRRILAELITKEYGEESFLEVESTEQALNVVKKYKIAFAVVGLSSKEHDLSFITEKIKLCNPAIPVLSVEINNRSEQTYITNGTDIQKNLNTAVYERIMAGVRYVKSLTNCGVKGFTVVVKE